MRRFTPLAFIGFLAIAACNTTPPHRAEFSGSVPVEDCPDSLQGRVALSAEVFDLPAPPVVQGNNYVPTIGAPARRLLISATPAALDPRDRITWSELSIDAYGGTFQSWTRLVTDRVALDPLAPQQPATRRDIKGSDSELATVTLFPGQIKVTRVARGNADLAGTVAVDLVVMPGGIVVDNNVVHIARLWTPEGMPLASKDVTVEFSPTRHPPGLDVVEASAELKFVVRQAKTGDEWVCSAQTRTTLVSEDDIRLPLWDLGLASANAGRKSWLAVFSPSVGAVRMMFGSPAEANALANWIQTTHATTLGQYTLGVFQQSRTPKGPSFVPVDAEALKTFRPLTDADMPAIRVGPVGEP
jgi:hypothetical protein